LHGDGRSLSEPQDVRPRERRASTDSREVLGVHAESNAHENA
jgi:hypothetical protein